MRRFVLTLLASALLTVVTAPVDADHRLGGYPKVRTFSGGYYGPTQAHYQYQRRYGRSWHGHGGLTGGYGVGYVNGWPGARISYSVGSAWPYSGYGGYGYGSALGYGGLGYSSYYRTSPFGPGCGSYSSWGSYPLGATLVQPTLILQNPGIYTPFPSMNPLATGALSNNGSLLQQQFPDLFTPSVQPLGVKPLGDPNVPLLPPSTPEAQLRSLQHQQHGDTRLRNLDYLQAYLRYQDAVRAAGDRVEPHYRMGIALTGMKRLEKAVREFKTATALDPSWADSTTLTELLGDDQRIGMTQLKQRVAEWALGDAYDADRLYLLGTLLHLDGDPERARILFETAAALVGREPHLTAFLAPSVPPRGQEPGTVPEGMAVPQLPPVPDSVEPPPPADPPPPGNTTSVHPSLKQTAGPIFPSSF